MTLYSHSRLEAFEQCRYRYKLRYIDKVPSPVKKSVEAHLGECVHDALEWFYKNIMDGKTPTVDELIGWYSVDWQKKDTDEIVIVRDLSKRDYFNKGVKFLIDYYMKNQPFEDGTIETEKKIWINLEKNFPHKVIGYIDRLVYNKEKGTYEIHDYKTANTLPDKSKFQKDRQLALYSIAVKELYGDKPVSLIWHYLNYNMKIISSRTSEQLEKLKRDTVELINKIEVTNDFPTNKSVLCNWCEYKQYCKAWGNSLPPEFVKDEKPENIEKNKEEAEKLEAEAKRNFPTLSKYLKD